jgi:2-(1,2-epoxy-1,2-dihydrophenyl)acetyl-CoA isomerase
VNVLRSIDAGVGLITLDRPEKMNAISIVLGRELERAIAELGADPEVNVIVISGAGGNFCAGGDFAEVERLRAEGPAALTDLFDTFRRACDAVALVDVPVIAAVQGVAAAGGFELMQAADIVLVSDDARITDSHVNFGMIPGGGSTARLPRIAGRQQALALLLSGDRLSGVDAVRLGLAYQSFPHDEFDSAVRQFATRLAGRSRQAVTTIKRLVHAGLDRPLADALDAEIIAVVQHIAGQAGHDSVERFNGTKEKGVRA